MVVYSEGPTVTPGGASLEEGATLKFDPGAEFYIGGVPPTVEVSNFLKIKVKCEYRIERNLSVTKF